MTLIESGDSMFSFFKHKKEEIKESKRVIITIHGYGRRRSHEFDNLTRWGNDLEVVQFDLFDIQDESDNDWMIWTSRAKEKCEYYLRNGYTVDVIGFSMGGVIASYIAATCEINRLVLIAPAFNYLNLDKIYSAFAKQASKFFSNDEAKETSDKVVLPASFDNTFMSLVKELKKYIAYVKCPVLLLHGDKDEVIPVRSSLWAFDQIPHQQKQLILLHNGPHRMLMDRHVGYSTFQTIKSFLQGDILPDQKISFSPDPLHELDQEESL